MRDKDLPKFLLKVVLYTYIYTIIIGSLIKANPLDYIIIGVGISIFLLFFYDWYFILNNTIWPNLSKKEKQDKFLYSIHGIAITIIIISLVFKPKLPAGVALGGRRRK